MDEGGFEEESGRVFHWRSLRDIRQTQTDPGVGLAQRKLATHSQNIARSTSHVETFEGGKNGKS